MSRFHNRNFELLEPYDAKVSRTVLRGEGSSNAPDLLDVLLFYLLLMILNILDFHMNFHIAI